MAAYEDLAEIYRENSTLRERTAVAVTIAIELIRSGGDDGVVDTDGEGFSQDAGHHDVRKAWAKDALIGDLGLITARSLRLVLASNRGISKAQIEAAPDSALQVAVNEAVDLLAGN